MHGMERGWIDMMNLRTNAGWLVNSCAAVITDWSFRPLFTEPVYPVTFTLLHERSRISRLACLSVHLSVHEHTAKTRCPDFTKFLVVCCPWSWHYRMLSSSGFEDDIMFARSWPIKSDASTASAQCPHREWSPLFKITWWNLSFCCVLRR